MQLKIPSKWLLLVIVIAVISLSLPASSKSAEYAKSVFLSRQESLGLPIRLKIPKISVDAKIDYVGITLKGAMDTPKGPAEVAWFNLGPRPGDNGSAVIDGHYGRWKNGGGSVFDNLNKLGPGDKIYVEDDKGVIITFLVQKLRMYGQNEYAPEVFSSIDNKAHLNLITCAGAWNKILKTYSSRLVIFADREIK